MAADHGAAALHARQRTPTRCLRHRRPLTATRAGFTLVEMTIALAIVVILGVIVAQCLTWSMRERSRAVAQHAALELADNLLEAARAQPWDKLDQTWADAQTVPEAMADLLPEGKVVVTVKADPLQPGVRRIEATVAWQFESYLPPHSVQLTALRSARSAKTGGAAP